MFFTIKAYVKHVTLWRGHFWPQGHNLNNLDNVHQVMVCTKYQDSMPYGFRQEDFFMLFTILAYVKHVTPGWGHFWPQGHYLNNVGRGLLVDATYQISTL